MTGREELRPVASLIKLRNRVDREIAATIGRPAHPGHIGRFVAAAIFDIRLYKSATHRGLDGQFTSRPLAGTSVSIRKYSTDQGCWTSGWTHSRLLPRTDGGEGGPGVIPQDLSRIAPGAVRVRVLTRRADPSRGRSRRASASAAMPPPTRHL